MHQSGCPGGLGGGGDMAGAIDVNTLEGAAHARKQDADQINHHISAVNGGGDLIGLGNIGGPGHHLAGITEHFDKGGSLNIAHGDADMRAGGG
jgi:hypothetical protein